MSRLTVAIIAGGASTVAAELAQATELCAACGITPTVFAVNDQIERYSGPCVAVTLHTTRALYRDGRAPGGLPLWLARRAAAGFQAPSQVWAHRPAPGVTHTADDWGGSGGLFAFICARKAGFEKVIFSGVPMVAGAGHFVRGNLWTACDAFRDRGWVRHLPEIKSYARSCSGWTAERLGMPDEVFLKGRMACHGLEDIAGAAIPSQSRQR